jgi:transcriptional regulator with XRE-family HTH domain
MSSAESARERLGRRVRKLRAGVGLTQEELAVWLDTDVSYVGLLETGRVAPSIGMLQTLGEVFGLSLDELLRGIRFPRRARS